MSDVTKTRMRKLSLEKDKREREFLRVYRPMEHVLPFHLSRANERLVRGGKRSGKSVAVVAEIASILTGEPIIGLDGNPLPRIHPVATPDNPLIYWTIGLDVKHIGQTIYKLLFKAGMGGTFRVIKDAPNLPYRVWDKTNPDDIARRKESKLSEPAIPERFIKRIVWDSEGSNQFEKVELHNGATLYAYPSSSRKPKMGDAVAGIWIDEDIMYYGHLSEWQDRLTDLNGWFLWSVWPNKKNPAVEELIDRAEEQEGEENPRIQCFTLKMTDNKFITDEAKKNALERMGDAENIASRNEGDLNIESSLMYEIIPDIHFLTRKEGTPSNPLKDLRSQLDYYLNKGWPREWTRYFVIDPSFTRTACHSFVIPPPESSLFDFGHIAIMEWELIGRRCGPKQLCELLKPKMFSYQYEAFVMDKAIGRQTRVGSDESVFEAYSKEFRKEKILSRQTHEGFIPGCNHPPTCFRAVRELLGFTETGYPSLFIVKDTCPETVREFHTYRKKTLEVAGEVTSLDEPRNPRKHDCMASLQYFAAFIRPLFETNRAYVDPVVAGQRSSPVYEAAKRLRREEEARSGGGFVHLGAGSGI